MSGGGAGANRKGRGTPGGSHEQLGDGFSRLAGVMARLRSEDGCPWDLEQTPTTLSRHMLEEAYEAVEAIDEENWGHLEEELGDLMLQIVFQARIAQEEGRFDLGDVVDGITEKLLRRHPHIFGEARADTAEEVAVNWDRIKMEEEGKAPPSESHLGLPATMGALKLQNRAARDGFDWSDCDGIFSKIEEEVEEVRQAMDEDGARVEHELGDLMFTVVNLARHLGVDPETALRRTNREFARRYSEIEREALLRGVRPDEIPLDEKEDIWNRAKEMAAPPGREVDERDK